MLVNDTLSILSQSDLGAVIIRKDFYIIKANDHACFLLKKKEEELIESNLRDIAPELCEESPNRIYCNISFGNYLIRCKSPMIPGLPEDQLLIVFRDATLDACHDMLLSIITQMNDGVALYDAEGRLWMLNDATVTMENLITSDVLGQKVESIYQMTDGSSLLIPRVLKEKKLLKDVHCEYITKYGKKIDVVTDDIPIVQNGQLLGAACVMKDWTTVRDLNKQIINLQEQLRSTMKKESKKAGTVLGTRYHFSDIIHFNKDIDNVIKQCSMVAQTDSAVMIYGETGTGKELFAQSIHAASYRSEKPFLAINCAAIPENLLESMLFGTVKGAYTGAENRPGLFEQADGGTLLLDEINSMNMGLQAKLLRVLQEGSVRRVGGSAVIPVDVRIISNINIPPYQAVEEKKLRQDLYYRLGVVNIHIPPLRERKDDIPLLAKYFMIRYNKKMSRAIRTLSPAVLDIFNRYEWPGNVRELQHAIEHAMNVLPETMSSITVDSLPWNIKELVEKEKVINTEEEKNITSFLKVDSTDPVPTEKKKQTKNAKRTAMERNALIDILKKNHGNISKTARELDISRQNLQYKIKKHGIDIQKLE